MSIETLPGIEAACFLIALDNGGINRSRSAKKQSRQFRQWVAKQDYPNMPDIDAWLFGLCKEELELVCAGGSDEPEVQALKATAPAFTDDLLNAYFDEIC